MRELVKLSAICLVGLAVGYFYGKSVPIITYFKRDRILQEVRDSYYNRCTVDGAVLRKDGVSEEMWSCPKLKVFLIKRYVSQIN